MLANHGFGTYVFYAVLCLLLLVLVVMFLRLALMLSLLWIQPVAALLRRVRFAGRFIPRHDDTPGA